MSVKIRLTNQGGGYNITHIKRQRHGKFIFPHLAVEFDSEDECKEFCEVVGNDPMVFLKILSKQKIEPYINRCPNCNAELFRGMCPYCNESCGTILRLMRYKEKGDQIGIENATTDLWRNCGPDARKTSIPHYDTYEDLAKEIEMSVDEIQHNIESHDIRMKKNEEKLKEWEETRKKQREEDEKEYPSLKELGIRKHWRIVRCK